MIKKVKLTKENLTLLFILILSAILNFANLSIEGTANSYYAAAVKSMTTSFKNFFFVSFDPSGFVTIDKPPLGYWLQAISAKIFGFSGWSILLPQALAGVISVALIYHIVKRAFGSKAGLISALFLAVTPVFVAVSRNNTVDNVLVLALLLACWAISIAAEKGKLKYLIISMAFVGVGFNIKMLQAYMVVPALYITYLLSSGVSVKKEDNSLMSWYSCAFSGFTVMGSDCRFYTCKNRPYVDSSTNNTVMELIVGHNGLERISLGGSSNQGTGGMGGHQGNGERTMRYGDGDSYGSKVQSSYNLNSQGMPGNPPSGYGGNSEGMPGNPPSGDGQMGKGGMKGNNGGMGGLSGTFGSQTKASITRLFSKNILSDQIVWFIPLALIGFIAAVIKEKLKIRLDNKKKQSLMLWFMWFLPSFIYFSYNTGTFHSYYLTMLAPPVSALAGIGIVSMWELYKEGGWKSWFLPVSLISDGAVHLLMLYYFMSSSYIVKILMVIVVILCFVSSLILIIVNLTKKNHNLKLKKILVCVALAGLLATPFVGSAAVLSHELNGSFPAAGLELLSENETKMGGAQVTDKESGSDSKLIEFLVKNKTKDQKYLLVVGSSSDGADIIVKTGQPVMSLGGFLGSNKAITLNEFKELVKKGEIRYVMTGSKGGSSNSEIMNWAEKNGKVVSTSEYSSSSGTSSNDQNQGGFDGGKSSGQLYDLKSYTDSFKTK